MGKRLTEKDIQQINALYEDGAAVKDIVETTGKSISSVNRALAGFRVARKGKKSGPAPKKAAKPRQYADTRDADYWRAKYKAALRILLEKDLLEIEL